MESENKELKIENELLKNKINELEAKLNKYNDINIKSKKNWYQKNKERILKDRKEKYDLQKKEKDEKK